MLFMKQRGPLKFAFKGWNYIKICTQRDFGIHKNDQWTQAAGSGLQCAAYGKKMRLCKKYNQSFEYTSHDWFVCYPFLVSEVLVFSCMDQRKTKWGWTSTRRMVTNAVKHRPVRVAPSPSTSYLSFIMKCHLKPADFDWYVRKRIRKSVAWRLWSSFKRN